MENTLYVKTSYGSLGEGGEKTGRRGYGEEGTRVFKPTHRVISNILDGELS